MRTLRFVLLAGLVLGVSAGSARAGTPFGGDDSGFVPPDKTTLKCENTVAKNGAKLTLAVTICHMKAADAGVKAKSFDEEACETAARGKYDAANLKLTGCPACLNASAIGDNAQTQLDGLASAAIYCDNTGTPFGGDDLGFVPTSKAAEKCQNAVAKDVALLAGALVKCHSKLAAQTPNFDEEACETAASTKFNALTGKLTNCPACLTALLPTIGSSAATQVDTTSGATYCASPSGAFVN